MLEIRRIRIRSVIKVFIAIHVALYVLAGLIIAALYAVVHGLLLRSFFSSGISALNLLLIWLAGTVVVAVHALILGWVVGLIYNFVASWWGGVVCEIGVVNNTRQTTHSDQHETVQREQQRRENSPEVKNEQKRKVPRNGKNAAAIAEQNKEQHNVPGDSTNRTTATNHTNQIFPTNPTFPTHGSDDQKERKPKVKDKRARHDDTAVSSVPAPLVPPQEQLKHDVLANGESASKEEASAMQNLK